MNKVGDKVLVEGTISMVGDGFCRVEFKKLGNHATQHVRIWDELISPVPAKRAPKAASE